MRRDPGEKDVPGPYPGPAAISSASSSGWYQRTAGWIWTRSLTWTMSSLWSSAPGGTTFITVRGRMKGCGSKVNFCFSYTVSVYSVTYFL
jgi:hypothetical protein